jgi:glycosyltransferase involved in cell wall biosynthesis
MLGQALEAEPSTTLVRFSFRTALLGRYDVFHVHWPEILMEGHSPLKELARQLLCLLFLVRLRLTRTAVVRTMHNIERPQGMGRRAALLLDGFDRATTLQVRLNELTPTSDGMASVVIPHGHYRDWFASFPRSSARPGQIGYVGLIRRYKGVENLVQAFRSLTGGGVRLAVAGKPSSAELAETLEDAAAADPRIELTLRFLTEAELVGAITAAQVVVLPYRFMHNSGATLAALSLDRPVLVPANDVNAALAAEVGPAWVTQFEGDLTPEALSAALAAGLPPGSPDLSRREWSDAGRTHAAAYRSAIAIRRAGRKDTPVPV